MGTSVRGLYLLVVLLIAGCNSTNRSIPLPKLALKDVQWVEVSRHTPEPAKRLEPKADAARIQPLLDAFNSAKTATPRDKAATPPLKVEIRLQNGEGVLLALSDETRVMATWKGEAIWIDSAALRDAIMNLERTLPK